MSCHPKRLIGLAASIAASLIGLASAAQGAEPSLPTAADQGAVTVADLPPEIRELLLAIMTQPRVSPGVAFGSPVGFGARGGDYFFGVNGATTSGNKADGVEPDFIGDLDIDGSFAAGFGIGNPATAVGVEVAVNVISLTNEFGDSGSAAIKVHRNIGERGALSIGTENDLAWGEAKDYVAKTTSTKFVSYSHYFQLRNSPRNPGGLMVTLGAGDGRLGEVDDPKQVTPFVSVGYAWTRQFSTIVDYGGETTNVAVSIVPWRTIPIATVFGWSDLEEKRADSTFSFGLGYSNRF
ncbi:hypothetical protein [Povalibacter sp.]|uniref:hypothetical protein n=1 Tax=Povalibacter sp. TaxID=1962978 RepID=UPI002F3FC12C